MARVARWTSKAAAVAPALVVSTVVTSMVGSLLPPLAGAALFVGGLLLTVALLFGRMESAAARLVLVSRPARPQELGDLAPALTLLCRAGLGPPIIDLRVRVGQATIAAGGMGRRTVVISRGLLDAVVDGALPQEQAAAVIGHAAALTRAGWVRSDAAIAYWSLPWQVLREGAVAVARVGRHVPLTAAVWRLRGVVIGIAVVQNIHQGHIALATVLVILGLVSYAMPLAERRWQKQLMAAGDSAVTKVGLGAPLAAFLARYPASPTDRARARALDPAPAPARPIGLVRL